MTPVSGVTTVETARDRRDDLRVLLWTTGALLVTFSVGSTLQTVFLFRPERLTLVELVSQAPLLPARLFTNLATVAGVLLVCGLVRLNERRRLTRVAWLIVIALGAGLARHGLQLLLGIYVDPQPAMSIVEVGSVAGVVVLSASLALGQVRARVRLRSHERASAEQRLRASAALAQLAAEEVRVRREVAEGLHGTLQGRLVMTQTRVDAIVRRVQEDGGDATMLEQLEEVGRELETMRERDVREFSQLVYPVGVDVSLGHAVRMLARRVPADIAVTADISPAADAALDGASADAVGRRIALVRATEEGITNALRHGAATRIRIHAAASETAEAPLIRLTVDDDGSGPPEKPRWNGLARATERIGLHGGTVQLGSSALGGGRLEITLPV